MKAARTREHILELAIPLASERGLEGVTLGELAARAKLSKSGLFAHFASKEELQLDVLNAVSDRFVRLVMAPAWREPAGESRLVAFHRLWWDNWFGNAMLPGGCVLGRAAHEEAMLSARVKEKTRALLSELLRDLETQAKVAIESGAWREDVNAGHVILEMYATLTGSAVIARLLRTQDARRQSQETFASLMARCRKETRLVH